ncbi:MAG TPA: PEGA domain-containing protein [Leptospiraceae bacterium]|nr:PEGA domain-containing protein [Leptospiraceae bacterium]HMW60277.1 PEGA domain-containing protein [Leptospiraceae bacterium]
MRSLLKCLLPLVLAVVAGGLSAETRRIRIVTEPTGADVYVDGVLAGKTPLDVETDGRLKNIRIVSEGFREISFPLRADGGAELVFGLRKAMQTLPDERSSGGLNFLAMARSAILPGWGQYSKGDGSAFLFGAGTIFAGGLLYQTHLDVDVRRRAAVNGFLRGDYYSLAYYQAQALTNSNLGPTFNASAVILASDLMPSRQDTLINSCVPYSTFQMFTVSKGACDRFHRARRNYHRAKYAFAGMYLWNVLDALIADPRSTVSFSSSPVLSDEEKGVYLGAVVRF